MNRGWGKVVIMGDFNIPDLNCNTSQISRELKDFCGAADLTSRNTIKNHMGRTLDLVLSNIANIEIECAGSMVQNVDQFHPPLLLSVELSTISKKNPQANQGLLTQWNFAKGDFLNLYKELQAQNWEAVCRESDVDSAVTNFEMIFNNILSHTIPQKNIKKLNQPIWINKNIVKKIRKKEFYRKKFKNTGELRFRLLYEETRRETKNMIKSAKEQYQERLEKKLYDDPKTFWKFIKQTRNSGSSSDMFHNILIADNCQ